MDTVTRIRGERDDLRLDLEFLNAENRFAVQSLQEKLAAATSAPVTPASTDTDHTTMQGYVQAFQEQRVVARAIVAQHTQEHGHTQATRIQALLNELFATRSTLQQHQLTTASL